MTPRLITIPFSHYCEKARWALDRRGIAYVEEGHLPVLHARATRAVGGRSTPLLVIGEGDQRRSLTDSTDILHFADAAGTRSDVLFPVGTDANDGGVAADVVALEERFDEVLGPHSRRLAYFFLFNDAPALRAVIERAPVPAMERALAGATLPVVTVMLRRAMNVTDGGAARSRSHVEVIFKEVDERLADGRRFLTGDRFTAADLTFAALAAPLVMPSAYAQQVLPVASMGAPFRHAVDGWRATRAGQFAMTLFAQQRDPSMSDRSQGARCGTSTRAHEIEH